MLHSFLPPSRHAPTFSLCFCFYTLTFKSWNVRGLSSLCTCCRDRTSTSTIPIHPFWQAACSCHNQDFLAVSLVRLNPYAARNTQCLLTWENYRECIQDYTGFDLEVHRPPSHHLKCTGRATVFFPQRISSIWLWPHAFFWGFLRDYQNTSSQCTPLNEGKRHYSPIPWPPWTSSVANIWTNWVLLI